MLRGADGIMSMTDNTISSSDDNWETWSQGVWRMPRNGEEVHRCLQQAALELFHERGYDQTTAAEIAVRAEVTSALSFRHFSDKGRFCSPGQTTCAQCLLKKKYLTRPTWLGRFRS